MLTIPKDSINRQIDRFQVLRDAVCQTRKAASEENQNRIANTKFTRRDGMKAAACGLAYASGLGSVVEALPQTALTAAVPSAGLLKFFALNKDMLHVLFNSILMNISFFAAADSDLYEIMPEKLENTIFLISDLALQHSSNLEVSPAIESIFPKDTEERIQLIDFFNPSGSNRAEKREANKKALACHPLFKSEIESLARRYHNRLNCSYEQGVELAANTLWERVDNILGFAVNSSRDFERVIKVIEERIPNSQAVKVLKRLWQKGPRFLKTDPWFQAKKAKMKEEWSLEKKKSAKKDPQKKQATKYKQELYEKFNYQVLLRLYNPEIDEYDQFVF